MPCMQFVPTSTKRPHWVLLGFRKNLVVPGVQGHTVLGKRLVSFAAPELQITEAHCHHRGASLEGGTVRDGCVVCPFHRRSSSQLSHPHRFYDYATLQGLVWIDFGKHLITQHHMPPYHTEFSSKDYVVVEERDEEVDVHPLVLVEHLLNPWQVNHREVRRSGAKGSGRAAVDTPFGPLTVTTEFDAPYTATHRFQLGDQAALLVWQSIVPTHVGRCKLHTRVARHREALSSTKLDWVEARVPSWHVSEAVRTVDVAQWRSNHLDDADALVTAYRASLASQFADLEGAVALL